MSVITGWLLFLSTFMFATHSDKPVTFQRVEFPSHGVKLVGNLYFPEAAKKNGGAIVVVGPQTSLKEQLSAQYAARLREQGFMALAFDPRSFGESGGMPREFENPQWKIEDIQSAVLYLRSRSDVRAEQVGVLGVCCGGAYAAKAAAIDPNIKAVALVAGNMLNPKELKKQFKAHYDQLLTAGRKAREKYQSTGEVDYIPNISTDPSQLVAMPLPGSYELYAPYLTNRSTRWRNRSALMFWEPFLKFDVLEKAEKNQTPTVMIHSEKAFFPPVAKAYYSKLRGKKEQHWSNREQLDYLKNPKAIGEAAATAGQFLNKHLVKPEARQPARSK